MSFSVPPGKKAFTYQGYLMAQILELRRQDRQLLLQGNRSTAEQHPGDERDPAREPQLAGEVVTIGG